MMHMPAVGDMVKVAVVVRVFAPLVPVTVIVPVPAGAVAAVVTVSVAVVRPFGGGVTEAGLIEPLAPEAGGSVTVNVTGELNEFTEKTVIVKALDEPFRTVAEVGEIDSVKFGAAMMIRVTFVV
jgi:hypothetical protein